MIVQYIPPTRSAKYAYKMGYDCEMNGANERNCHFSIFSNKENMKAWEAGKREAAQQESKRREVDDNSNQRH